VKLAQPNDIRDRWRRTIQLSAYRAGEKIQSKGRIRKSLVLDALPVQPHRGLSQEISSSPKIFMASFSESAGSEHFRWKLIVCPPLGHAKTILYALLMHTE
jgi:hypothetical protein